MAEFSAFWTTGGSTGDQQAGYTQVHWSNAQRVISSVNGAEGVAADYLNELAGTVTGANTVSINTGGAVVDGKWYNSDSAVAVNIPSAVGGGNTRIDRIVLRCSWAGFTIRIFRIAGTDAASPTAPAITTTSGTTYDIMLYRALVDTGGAVTVTDERNFALINTAEIENIAVTTPKIAVWAVTTDRIADLAVTGSKMATDSVYTGNIVNLNVTQAKLAPGASKVTNRQGGDVTIWTTTGTTNYVPTTARIQAGAINTGAGTNITVTFPVAFSSTPLIFLQPLISGASNTVIPMVHLPTATNFIIYPYDSLGNSLSNVPVYWIAIGSE